MKLGVTLAGGEVLEAGRRARETEDLGASAVWSTEDPGHANALPGLVTVFAADTPLLLLSGRVATENWGLGAIQEMPQGEIVRTAAKWSRSACRR